MASQKFDYVTESLIKKIEGPFLISKHESLTEIYQYKETDLSPEYKLVTFLGSEGEDYWNAEVNWKGYTIASMQTVPNLVDSGSSLINDPDNLKAWNVEVHPEHRRKGLASAMYKAIEQASGMNILGGDFQTPDGKELKKAIGEEYWGKAGAGGLFYAKDTGRYLFAHRSSHVDQPDTWGTWGGRIETNESPEEALKREAEEESGYSGPMKIKEVSVYKDGDFKFYNFIMSIPQEFEPTHSWETQGHLWTTLDQLPSPLHFGVKEMLNHLQTNEDTKNIAGVTFASELPSDVEVPLEHRGEDFDGWEESQYNYRLNNASQIEYAIKNKRVIGHLGLSSDNEVMGVYVDPSHEGQGIATQLYINALKDFGSFWSDPMAQEPGGKAIWKKLEQLFPDQIALNKKKYSFIDEINEPITKPSYDTTPEESTVTEVKTKNGKELSLDQFISMVTSVAKKLGFEQPGKAYWQCSDFSMAVWSIAKELGIPIKAYSADIQFRKPEGELKQNEWTRHTFLKLGNTYYDWTARQFIPKSPFPYVSKTLDADYRNANALKPEKYGLDDDAVFYYDKLHSAFWAWIKMDQVDESISDWDSGIWIHYSHIPEVKINPQQFHQDPTGIYLFPESFKQEGSWFKYPYKFRVATTATDILDISTLTKESAIELLKKMVPESYHEGYIKEINDSSTPMDAWWECLKSYFVLITNAPGKASWAKAFRNLGYDAIFDDTGIIHIAETQLLVLDPSKIKVLERIEQKESGFAEVKEISNKLAELLKPYGTVTITGPKRMKEYGQATIKSKVKVTNGDHELSFSVSPSFIDKKDQIPNDIHVYLEWGAQELRRQMSQGVTFQWNKQPWDYSSLEQKVQELAASEFGVKESIQEMAIKDTDYRKKQINYFKHVKESSDRLCEAKEYVFRGTSGISPDVLLKKPAFQGDGIFGAGTYFAMSEEEARSYIDTNIQPVILGQYRIQGKILYIKADTEDNGFFTYGKVDLVALGVSKELKKKNLKRPEELGKAVLDVGYQAVVVTGYVDGGDQLFVPWKSRAKVSLINYDQIGEVLTNQSILSREKPKLLKASQQHKPLLTQMTALTEIIQKKGSKSVLYSKDKSKKLGTFPSKEKAQDRERQINYFKHQKESLDLLIKNTEGLLKANTGHEGESILSKALTAVESLYISPGNNAAKTVVQNGTENDINKRENVWKSLLKGQDNQVWESSKNSYLSLNSKCTVNSLLSQSESKPISLQNAAKIFTENSLPNFRVVLITQKADLKAKIHQHFRQTKQDNQAKQFLNWVENPTAHSLEQRGSWSDEGMVRLRLDDRIRILFKGYIYADFLFLYEFVIFDDHDYDKAEKDLFTDSISESHKEGPAIDDLLQSRIHAAFTKVADDLCSLGYMDSDQRIKLSSAIGHSLEAFREAMSEKCPWAKETKVDPGHTARMVLEDLEAKSLGGFTFSHTQGNYTPEPPRKEIVVTVKDIEGNRVGTYTFSFDPENKKYITPEDAWTSPIERRKGIATRAYQYVEQLTGRTVDNSGGSPSHDAKKLWSQPNRPFGEAKDFKETYYTAFLFDCSPDTLHMTHKYLGEQSAESIEKIIDLLDTHFTQKPFQSFTPTLVKEEWFGKDHDIRVLIADDIAPKYLLLDLKKQLDQFRQDEFGTYKPHVTTKTDKIIDERTVCYALLKNNKILQQYPTKVQSNDTETKKPFRESKGDWKNAKITFSHTEEPEMYQGEKTGNVTHTITAESPEGNIAGVYQFFYWGDPSSPKHLGKLDPESSNTAESYQRMGIATEAYRMIERLTGSKIRQSSGNQTHMAQSFWKQKSRPFGEADRLNEGLSKVLFHRTEIQHLASILNQDEFILTSSAGSHSDKSLQPSDKLYYMSFSRNPSGYQSGVVIVVIDGQKLSQKYQGGPVDYWGREFRKAKPTISEQEDRVWSDQPTIPHAMSYIQEIHTLIWNRKNDVYNDYTDKYNKELRQILIQSKKNGIPVFVYDDSKYFQVMNTDQAISLDQMNLAPSLKPKEPGYNYRDKDSPRDMLDGVVELYRKTNRKDLSQNAFKQFERLRGFDFSLSLDAEIHNEKKHKSVRGITSVMQDGGFKSTKDLIVFLFNKWEDKIYEAR